MSKKVRERDNNSENAQVADGTPLLNCGSTDAGLQILYAEKELGWSVNPMAVYTISFPKPGSLGCDTTPAILHAPWSGDGWKVSCPNQDATHQGFTSEAFYGGPNADLVEGRFTSNLQQDLSICHLDGDAYTCTLTRVVGQSHHGTEGSYTPFLQQRWTGCVVDPSRTASVFLTCNGAPGSAA